VSNAKPILLLPQESNMSLKRVPLPSQLATLLDAKRVPPKTPERPIWLKSQFQTFKLKMKFTKHLPHSALPSDATPRPLPHTNQVQMINGQETMVSQITELIEIFLLLLNIPQIKKPNTENGLHFSTKKRPRSIQWTTQYQTMELITISPPLWKTWTSKKVFMALGMSFKPKTKSTLKTTQSATPLDALNISTHIRIAIQRILCCWFWTWWRRQSFSIPRESRWGNCWT